MADDIIATAEDHGALDAALEGMDLIPTNPDSAASAPAAAPRADQVHQPEASPGGLEEGEGAGEEDPLEAAAAAEAAAAPNAVKPHAEEDIEVPKGLSVKGAQNWQKLRGRVADQEKKLKDNAAAIAALSAQIEALKKQPAADPKLQERIKQLEGELADYRALYQTENDKDFKAKFDDVIAANDVTIYGILQKHGLPEEAVKKIQGLGGPLRLSDTYWRNQVFHVQIKNPQGQPTGTWEMPMADEDAIRFALRQNASLTQQRQQALEAIPKNKEEFQATKKAEREAQFKAYDAEFWNAFGDFSKGVTWAKPQEIPKDATPQQRALIEKDNIRYAKLAPIFDAAKYPATAKIRAEVCCTVALAFVLQEDLDAAHAHIKTQDARIAELEEKLTGIKKSGITHNKGGAAPKVPPRPDTARLLDMKDEDAIDAGLDGAGVARR